MKRCFLLFTGILLICSSCGNKEKNKATTGEIIPMKYATGFSLTQYPDYIVAELRNPWDTTRLLHRYLLINRTNEVPDNLPSGTIVRIPVENIVAYSSVHVSMLDELNATDRITGVCEAEYIGRASVRKRIEAGEIADLGSSFAPHVEKIIEFAPEVILASPYENCNYGRVEKLGVPIIECADYMETTPLGRAEWIRFLGLLAGRKQVADSLFKLTECRYDSLCRLSADAPERPTVFAEKRTGSTWFVPGGASYMARLFADAGANYLWRDDSRSGSLALSFEEVFDKAQQADYWLFKYSVPSEISLKSLVSEYDSYSQFKAFQQKNVFGCNLSLNDFYEEMPLHPDLLLHDFIAIFHPDLLPTAELRYYHRLQP